ncbi:MAG: hypothetical protein CUN55_10870, partial [Phototrophicales bacterium]
ELGEATTRFVDEFMSDWQPPVQELPTEALIAVAIGDLLSRTVVQHNGGDPDADIYSAWAKSDSFRI